MYEARALVGLPISSSLSAPFFADFFLSLFDSSLPLLDFDLEGVPLAPFLPPALPAEALPVEAFPLAPEAERLPLDYDFDFEAEALPFFSAPADFPAALPALLVEVRFFSSLASPFETERGLRSSAVPAAFFPAFLSLSICS
jgi:hypothetical protein